MKRKSSEESPKRQRPDLCGYCTKPLHRVNPMLMICLNTKCARALRDKEKYGPLEYERSQ